MASLLVVTGPPGAGKSTVAALLAADAGRSVLVEGDAFFGFLASGAVEPWLPAAHAQNDVVIRAAAAAAGRFAGGGFTTVFDGVVGPWFLPAFVAAAGLSVQPEPVALHYAVLLPPVERCVQRVAKRIGHGFTDEAATRKMHDEFTRAAVPSRHVVAEPGEGAEGGPKRSARLVRAALARGDLRVPLGLGAAYGVPHQKDEHW